MQIFAKRHRLCSRPDSRRLACRCKVQDYHIMQPEGTLTDRGAGDDGEEGNAKQCAGREHFHECLCR
jgi:hypothetical protein